ncbi:MAG: hypothetical protein IPM18_10500 [Phycisphaerales bacterium]|nr:hypothetical protein [Phycisphaerales bacterium]
MSAVVKHGQAGRGARGFMMAEMFVTIGICLLLIILATTAVLSYRQARQLTDAQRLLRALAETELVRIRCGGELPAAERMVQEVGLGSITLRRVEQPGAGPWQGCRRVEITATMARGERLLARVTSAVYIADSEDRP